MPLVRGAAYAGYAVLFLIAEFTRHLLGKNITKNISVLKVFVILIKRLKTLTYLN